MKLPCHNCKGSGEKDDALCLVCQGSGYSLAQGTPSEEAVAKILLDLLNRRGLKQEWNAISYEVQNEIRETWADIIDSEFTK